MASGKGSDPNSCSDAVLVGNVKPRLETNDRENRQADSIQIH